MRKSDIAESRRAITAFPRVGAERLRKQELKSAG